MDAHDYPINIIAWASSRNYGDTQNKSAGEHTNKTELLFHFFAGKKRVTRNDGYPIKFIQFLSFFSQK